MTIRNGSTAGGGGGIHNNGTMTLTNCTISGNSGSHGGGGIYHEIGTMTLIDSTITDNSGGDGGGIFNEVGALNIINSTISNSSASDRGGGIFNFSDGIVTLNGSAISSNSANNGGGIENTGTLTVTNSTVNHNTATTTGGIGNSGTLVMSKSTVSNNTATGATTSTGPGGGIMNRATATLVNMTISGNTAGPGHSGGGIFNCSASCGVTTASLALTNSTVSGNSAARGGGIDNDRGATVILDHTIIANNISGGDCSGAGSFTSLGYNLDSDGTCGLVATGDINNANPLFGSLQDNGGPTFTHALLPGSPAIDAGNPAAPGSGGNACEATDQRGVSRPQGARCDIGAFESIPAAAVPGLAPWALIALGLGLAALAYLRLGRTRLDVRA